MSSHRRISQVFGALSLLTFVTSIAAALLYQPVLDDPQGYIAGGGADDRIYSARSWSWSSSSPTSAPRSC